MNIKKILKNKTSKCRKKNIVASGFSLIEVLFAILVLSVGIVTIMTMISRSVKTFILAKNQIIAAELVQEGIELTRNLSDNEILVDGASYSNYRIFKNGGVISFTNALDKKLYLDANGFYTHTSVTATRFLRKIDVVGAVGSRVITSTVSWRADETFPATCDISNECISASSTISY